MPQTVEKSEVQNKTDALVEDFRKDLGAFVVAAKTTRMPMLFTDATKSDNPIIFANDAFLALTGYEHDEVLAQSFNALLARGAAPDVVAQVKASFEGAAVTDPVLHYRRKDSSEFWASIFVTPVRNERGEVLQHFVSLVDLTKSQEDQSHAQMLIAELNHRIKNTLQSVQSIVWDAFRNNADPQVVRASIDARILALSRSHDLLMSKDWDGAALLELVKSALEPFTDLEGRPDRITMRGADIELPAQATWTLGVTLHELATNAVKFGALSCGAGSVRITWTIRATPKGDHLLLLWEEMGGPAVAPPTRQGFGSRVIEQGLAHEMGGTAHLDFRRSGLVCNIEIPCAARAFPR